MTLYRFKLLPEDKQVACTLKYGVLTAIGETNHFKVLLYQLGNFYVEAYCHPHSARINHLKIFYSLEELEPYLAAIDLSDLIGSFNRIHLLPDMPDACRRRSMGFFKRAWNALLGRFRKASIPCSYPASRSHCVGPSIR